MKKMTFLACAAMLTSLVLTGCQSEDQNGPTQKVPEVTTDIAISLPGQVGGPNRMPGQTVQTNGPTHFGTNGMMNIILIPFAPKAEVSTSSVRYGNNIDLGTLDGSVALANSSRAKAYTGKQVPQGTSAFLFYGESGINGGAAKFNVGQLNAALTGNPATYKFELQSTCTSTTQVQNVADMFNAYLNGIINVNDTLYSGHKWYEITELENKGYKDMFDTLKTLNVLNTYGVERLMTDLFHSLDLNTDSLAKAIRDSILNPLYADTVNGKVVLVDNMQLFPKKFLLPEGAVSVAYSTATHTFGNNAAHSYGGLAPADLSSYVYPASLWYFANTQIKTSSSSKAGQYVDDPTKTTWKAILATYENNEATVNTSTRSIALIDTIQYGVARLDVKVKTAAGSDLPDNNPVEGLRTVTNPVGGYPLKAVLIGNQKNVGFDFTPATYPGSKTGSYVIYDTVMTSAIAALPDASVYSAANSTLVLETPADAGAGNEDVFVALEFENTAADFYGVNHQMIPHGARFYLVGKLSAAAATETGKKVFKQDYTTTAQFSINSLKNAYSTIPDLKAPSLEIGMSVDLFWSAGHTYEINFN